MRSRAVTRQPLSQCNGAVMRTSKGVADISCTCLSCGPAVAWEHNKQSMVTNIGTSDLFAKPKMPFGSDFIRRVDRESVPLSLQGTKSRLTCFLEKWNRLQNQRGICNLTNVSSPFCISGGKRAAMNNEIGIYEMKKRKAKRSRKPKKW